MFNRNKVSSLIIINNPYEKSVVIHNIIPLAHCTDLISQFTDITQSHISSSSTYTKSPHIDFDTDKYMASLTDNHLEEMEEDDSNDSQL